jgi:hypothetical protein
MRQGLLAAAIALTLPAAGCSTMFPDPTSRAAYTGMEAPVQVVVAPQADVAGMPFEEDEAPRSYRRRRSGGGVEPGEVLASSTRNSALWKREKPYDYNAEKSRLDAAIKTSAVPLPGTPATQAAPAKARPPGDARAPSGSPSAEITSTAPAQAGALAGPTSDASLALQRIMTKADKVGGTICRGC